MDGSKGNSDTVQEKNLGRNFERIYSRKVQIYAKMMIISPKMMNVSPKMMKENFEFKDIELLSDDSFYSVSQSAPCLKITQLTDCYLRFGSFLPVQLQALQAERPARGSGRPATPTPATPSPDWAAPPRPPMTPSPRRRHPASHGTRRDSNPQQTLSSKPESNDKSEAKHKLGEDTSRNHLKGQRGSNQPFSRLSAMMNDFILFKSQSHLLSLEPLAPSEEEFNPLPREEQKELSKLKRCLHSCPNKLGCGQIKPVI